MKFSVKSIQALVQAGRVDALLKRDADGAYAWDFLQEVIGVSNVGNGAAAPGSMAIRLLGPAARARSKVVALKSQVESLVLLHLYCLRADDRITQMEPKPRFIIDRLAKFGEIAEAHPAVGESVEMAALVRACIENRCLGFIFDGRADLQASFLGYLAKGLTDEVIPQLWQAKINITQVRSQIITREPHVESRVYHQVLVFLVEQLSAAEPRSDIPRLIATWLTLHRHLNGFVDPATLIPVLRRRVRAFYDPTQEVPLYEQLNFGAGLVGFDCFIQSMAASRENDLVMLSFLVRSADDRVLREEVAKTRCGLLLNIVDWAKDVNDRSGRAQTSHPVKEAVRRDLSGILGEMLYCRQDHEWLLGKLDELRQYVADLKSDSERWKKATKGRESKLKAVLLNIEQALREDNPVYQAFLEDVVSPGAEDVAAAATALGGDSASVHDVSMFSAAGDGGGGGGGGAGYDNPLRGDPSL